MSTLDDIQNALAAVDANVFYGVACGLPEGAPWNYTVFSRDTSTPKDSLTGFSHRYAVAVIREDYVPEGTDVEVIEAMCRIPGMRLDRSRDIEYRYSVKQGSVRTVVEMMVVRFVKAVRL